VRCESNINLGVLLMGMRFKKDGPGKQDAFCSVSTFPVTIAAITSIAIVDGTRPALPPPNRRRMGSWAEDVAFGAISKGVNQPTFVVLNICLLLAVLSLAFLLFASIATNPALVPHVAFLLFLAIGLWGAIVWFIGNIGLTDAQEQRKELFGEEGQQREQGEQEQEEPSDHQQQQQQRKPAAEGKKLQ
jgi:hypothetical protein